MWRDISNEVSLSKSKIIHDNQHICDIKYGSITVFKPNYRVRLERGVDQDGYFNKFYIEKDFQFHELQNNGIKQTTINKKPFVVVRKMKFLDVTHKEKELFINVDSICMIERLIANRCKLTLKTGQILELEYDAKRIRKKLEELEPEGISSI